MEWGRSAVEFRRTRVTQTLTLTPDLPFRALMATAPESLPGGSQKKVEKQCACINRSE
jgi:hypothetical protein